jgi:cardiolipin synthase A/B
MRALGRTTLLACTLIAFGAGCAAETELRAIDVPFPVSDPAFERTADALLGRPFEPGNRITTYVNGDGYFPPMFDAIRRAERSVTLETYIFWDGVVARELTDALCDRAAAGVKVHVIIDAQGKTNERKLIERMRRAGAQVEIYHSPSDDLGESMSMNNRTHRRVLVVDGHVGFTGGAGFADEWLGNADHPDSWRDTHLGLEGPVVRQLQAVFAAHWLEVTGAVLLGDDYFPPLPELEGGVTAQVFASNGGSTDDENETRMGFLLAIAAARREILIENPYFIPDDLLMAELVAARERGVVVRIIVPGPLTDVPPARAASRARWGELFDAGVELWEYEPTMIHAKVLIVDRTLVMLGTANMDPRSMDHNDEVNLNVLDAPFAESHAQLFARDLARSRRITYAEWDSRPWRVKAAEQGTWVIFGPLL